MESYANATNQSFNGTTDVINFDVPLLATTLSLCIQLVAVPTIIIPAVLVIRIILTTERLHTVYYLFVISLLATDILSTLKMGFEIILMCLYLFDINADSTISFVFFITLAIPRIAARLSFINLAIDRAVAIALPYRHKSIMTYRRAYVMIMLTWVISSIMCLAIYLNTSFAFARPFGTYTPIHGNAAPGTLYVILLVLSVIVIVCINVYLYVQINKSKQKLEENMRTHGTDGSNENKQLKRRHHKLQKQVKTTLSLLILGGVDGIINVITVMTVLVIIYIIIKVSAESMSLYALQFVMYPFFYIQLMSHSLLYGVYMKDIRRRLCKCYLYHRLKRAFPLRPSKVIVINKQIT